MRLAPALAFVIAAVSDAVAVPLAHGRRASAFERLAIDAAMDACARWGGEPSTLHSVFATRTADADAVDGLLRTVAEDPRLVSPGMFVRTVAGTLAGNWAIRTANHHPSTTLTAGLCTTGAGLLEAVAQVVAEASPCLLVFADVPPPGPLRMPGHPAEARAAALVLAPEGTTGRRARLTSFARNPPCPDPDELDRLAGHLRSGASGAVALSASPGLGLWLELGVDGRHAAAHSRQTHRQ